MVQVDGITEGANASGLFVWVLDPKGGFACERWPADMPSTKRPEPVTAYMLSEEQMTWPLNKLAILFPPPTRSSVVPKIKIS